MNYLWKYELHELIRITFEIDCSEVNELRGFGRIVLFIKKNIKIIFKFWQVDANYLPNYININSKIMMGYNIEKGIIFFIKHKLRLLTLKV